MRLPHFSGGFVRLAGKGGQGDVVIRYRFDPPLKFESDDRSIYNFLALMANNVFATTDPETWLTPPVVDLLNAYPDRFTGSVTVGTTSVPKTSSI